MENEEILNLKVMRNQLVSNKKMHGKYVIASIGAIGVSALEAFRGDYQSSQIFGIPGVSFLTNGLVNIKLINGKLKNLNEEIKKSESNDYQKVLK